MGEEVFIKLRYCFQAGYTLPQFCIDNDIKRPLFIMEQADEWFFRELYAQFKYDKRLIARFCFIDSKEYQKNYGLMFRTLGTHVTLKNISGVKINYYDAIIFLTKKDYNVGDRRIIRFDELEKFCIQRVYADIPLLNFLQRNPGVRLFLTNFPNDIKRYKEGAEYLSQLWDAGKLCKAIIKKKENPIETPFDKFGYTNQQVLEMLRQDKSKENLDGTTSLLDDESPVMNIRDGRRVTAHQPEHYKNKIYFFGACHYFGRNTSYDKTIASYLQKMINDAELPYCVENYGQAFSERTQDMFYNLNALELKHGDIIFFHLWGMHSNNDVIPFCDISDAFDPPHDYREVFCTKFHVNELGYKLVAEKYFKFLTGNNFFHDEEIKSIPPCQPYFHRYGIPPWVEEGGSKSFVSEELESYKKTLREKKLPIGALVMNCNPFTLGHQYLVEYAASKVVKLYLFVVEEDKSEFPFKDRIELVKMGVKNFPNVEVLPSGKFIISQTTFSGYFSKAELQDMQVDSSEDVEIFGKEIAPTLGITIRFAGEEPTDNVTRQYNETMKKILPRYGVEFCEIPRKTFGDEPISASKVRAALKSGDFEKVKNLVPATTYLYLRGRYSGNK